MSKTREPRGKSQRSAKEGRAKAGAEPAEVVWPPPLKPRFGLFIFLAILLFALFVGMLVLYFKTVYPYRH